MKRKITGEIGEKLAAKYLAEHGYQIIETNFHCKEGEVDIIAKEGDYLVFVEVRTKTSTLFGTPEESVTSRKKEHLRNAASRYLQMHNIISAEWRIDFVAVEMDSRGKVNRLEVIKNAIEGE